MDEDTRATIQGILAFITFAGCWIYCIATYGFLFGVGLGWLPSMIVAALVAALWPVVLVVVALVIVWVILLVMHG